MHGERRKHNKNKGEKDKDGGEAKLKKATTFSPRPTPPSLRFLSPHPAQRTPVLPELMLAPCSAPCPALTSVPRLKASGCFLACPPRSPCMHRHGYVPTKAFLLLTPGYLTYVRNVADEHTGGIFCLGGES